MKMDPNPAPWRRGGVAAGASDGGDDNLTELHCDYKMSWMNDRTRQIVDLFCATSDGSPDDLRRCIARGCPWSEPIPGAPSLSTPLNIAAQYQRPENLAILATKALQEGRPELLEAPDLSRRERPLNPEGRSPAYISVQKGNPVCLGVMAKVGANLHRAIPHTWQAPGTENLIDPDEECMPVHAALVETVMSFTTAMCLSCMETENVKVCNQCKMAYFCGSSCQKKKWPSHKKVCKKIRRGADLVTFCDSMPRPAQFDDKSFISFKKVDDELNLEEGEREEEYYDASKQWEYYDLRTKSWRAYPKKINQGIERMHDLGMSPRYMYKPGPRFDDAEGMEERELSTRPLRDVATNHVYYCHMIDHHIYTGSGRRIRRRVLPVACADKAPVDTQQRIEPARGIPQDSDDEMRRQLLRRMPELGPLLDEIDAGVEENEAVIRRINAAREGRR